ncbi:MAG TPA: hypothetical protein VFG68_01105 [Fimbriiglobus sp.]|nr:hypothetical protein [Fimbriiglobus sp.]
MSAAKPLPGYRSYKDLPQLAGLCTVEEAARPGLSVAECVRRLKRFHYAFKRLHEILTARITAEPIYELKTGFAHHAYLCAEHVTALRTRVGEMREPPLGLEDVPHPALEAFFDEVRAAPTTEELLAGLYAQAVGALLEAIEKYQAATNPLTDAPSRRVLRFAHLELDDMQQFGLSAVGALGLPDGMREWFTTILDPLIDAAGGLDGAAGGPPVATGGLAVPSDMRRYSKTPYVYDPVPRRDERFQDLWNQGVNAEAFLYSPEMPARAKVVMMLYKRLREIDVPEMMASILAQTPGKPWGYYRDMSRQVWDEARHAMMGEVGFVALGVDWTQVRVTWNWSHRLNTECTPMERHGVLYFIEQGLMPRTGKRYEYEVAHESGVPLAATIQDFDWADEVLHSQIGRQWYVPEFGTLQKALEYGDAAWSRILSNWSAVKAQGLTAHANWWPAVYAQACAAASEEPDPKALAFADTYEGTRADLQRVAAE